MTSSLPVCRERSPRLFRLADDPEYRFPLPADPERQRILANIIADCEAYAGRRPWPRLPERPESPHPFHQLYLTFYSAMQATALIEQYACAWQFTRERRWLTRARSWLAAAAAWEHSDRIEEHFYTANRYMQALAYALDLLEEELPPSEAEQATRCLVGLMERWWPEVDRQRRLPEGGHHAVVDNAHFGVAALHLLGRDPRAPEWVQAVIDRFRAAILPHGCGPAGEPIDGPSFWPWETLWLLQFGDALRQVTGIDLYREFPARLRRPLIWFRHHLVRADLALGAGARPVWSPTLLRLSQEAGDGELRGIALADEGLGRLYRFGVGAKGSPAECMISYGPYALGFCDPGFRAGRLSRRGPVGRRFAVAGRDRAAILRSGWETRSLVARITGYGGGVAHGFSDLQVSWAGQSLLQGISCLEGQPVSCGSLPCVGGQNEVVAVIGGLARWQGWDRLRLSSPRLVQEYWLRRGDAPVLLVATRRRRRTVTWHRRDPRAFVRLDGRDWLQYPREPWFRPEAGQVRLLVRLREEETTDRPRVLWATGLGVPGLLGTQVNAFCLGQFGGPGLVFAVQSQRYTRVEARILPEQAALQPGRWHEVTASWGGLNGPRERPFIEVSLDGVSVRCDDPARFGELGTDSQNLRSRTAPRTFYVHPNTALAFGAAVQVPGTGTRCDLGRIEVACPGRPPLVVDPGANSPAGETGSGPLVWKLNPVSLTRADRGGAVLAAGRERVEVAAAFPGTARFAKETVPFAPAGLAAGSLKRFAAAGEEQPATRLLVQAGEEEVLVLALAPRAVRLESQAGAEGFDLRTAGWRQGFGVASTGGDILVPRRAGRKTTRTKSPRRGET